jgi:hypothetical protein
MDTNRLMSAKVVTGCTIFGPVLRNTRERCTDLSLPAAESGTFWERLQRGRHRVRRLVEAGYQQ